MMTSLIDIKSAAEEKFEFYRAVFVACLKDRPKLSKGWRGVKPSGVTDIAWDEQLDRLLSRSSKCMRLLYGSACNTAFVLFRA